MTSQDYWQIFLETGLPEMYLLYCHARKQEETHVLDGQGIDIKGYKL